MTIQEYFGDWSDILGLKMIQGIMKRLVTSKVPICPDLKDVFKAFRLCSFHNLRCIVLSQDPYPNYRNNHPVATGLAFANSSDTSEENYSPSLKVLRESLINFSVPHNHIIFDPSLESWEEQGVLMLNTALTCEKGKPNSHMLLWRPFITDLLTTLSMCRPDLVYVLMGSVAQSLDMFIDCKHNNIIRCRHPAYYARTHETMPSSIWRKVNDTLIGLNGYGIEWYKEGCD